MARYQDCINWIVLNDDIEFLSNGDPISVTATMVANLFSKTEEQVIKDLRLAIENKPESNDIVLWLSEWKKIIPVKIKILKNGKGRGYKDVLKFSFSHVIRHPARTDVLFGRRIAIKESITNYTAFPCWFETAFHG